MAIAEVVTVVGIAVVTVVGEEEAAAEEVVIAVEAVVVVVAVSNVLDVRICVTVHTMCLFYSVSTSRVYAGTITHLCAIAKGKLACIKAFACLEHTTTCI